jgi:hypothetical protein
MTGAGFAAIPVLPSLAAPRTGPGANAVLFSLSSVNAVAVLLPVL